MMLGRVVLRMFRLFQAPKKAKLAETSHVLQKVCHYFTYKAHYSSSANEIPEFKIAPNTALELLMAANFLDI
ncbi:unnamed protein product [Heligmosomoides polygyrus]|uniref:Elongin-C n=1 Tax=Heligmosomoides polygyrus TaxID=6339 RepID=A0A183FTF4_HELPZ|nr:unnamed protein product [Heligmosomoides polygyrus]